MHNHEWNKQYIVKKYYDCMGTEVAVFNCICTKCGKKRNKKFQGHIIGQLF